MVDGDVAILLRLGKFGCRPDDLGKCRRDTDGLWRRILRRETNQHFHEGSFQELWIAMGAFDDLAEEGGGGGFVGRMSGGLLVFGFIGRRVEERDGEMNREDL